MNTTKSIYTVDGNQYEVTVTKIDTGIYKTEIQGKGKVAEIKETWMNSTDYEREIIDEIRSAYLEWRGIRTE